MGIVEITELKNVIYYSASTAAQVWSALIVFLIFLIRDKKAANRAEENELWSQARSWWEDLIIKLKDVNGGGLNSMLNEFDLDNDTVRRAETDREAFRKIMKAIKRHKIISKHRVAHRILGGHEYHESVLLPIAEKIEELNALKLREQLPFEIGIVAIFFNLICLWLMGFNMKLFDPKTIFILLVTVNLFFGILFTMLSYIAIDLKNFETIRNRIEFAYKLTRPWMFLKKTKKSDASNH